MEQNIIETLSALSEEERDILNGKGIQKEIYSETNRFIIDGKKLLKNQPFNLRRRASLNFPNTGTTTWNSCMYTQEILRT